MSIPPIRIMDPFALNSRRAVLLFGESTAKKTPIGIVAALANGAILFRDITDREQILSEQEARAVVGALSKAALAAKLVKERLTGFNVPHARALGAVYEIDYRGETRQAWRCVARRNRTCTACKQQVRVVWVADRRRGRWAEICEPCIDRLAKIPSGIREVEGAAP